MPAQLLRDEVYWLRGIIIRIAAVIQEIILSRFRDPVADQNVIGPEGYGAATITLPCLQMCIDNRFLLREQYTRTTSTLPSGSELAGYIEALIHPLFHMLRSSSLLGWYRFERAKRVAMTELQVI